MNYDTKRKSDNIKLVQVDEEYLKSIIGNTSCINHTDTNKIIGTLLDNGSVELDLRYSNNTLTISNIPSNMLTDVKIARTVAVPKTCIDTILSDIKDQNNINFAKGAIVYDEDTLEKTHIEDYIKYSKPPIIYNDIRFVPIISDIKTYNIKFRKYINVVTNITQTDKLSIPVNMAIPIENYDDIDEDTHESVLCLIDCKDKIYAFIVTAIAGYITIE